MVKLTTRMIIEVAGFPKEHVEEVMKKVVEKIKQEQKVLSDVVHEAKELKEMWGSFVELEITFKDLNDFTDFCFEYMPSSIDVLEPENFSFTSLDLSNLYNDLMGNIHRYDMLLKNFKATNTILRRQLDDKEKKEEVSKSEENI